MSGTSAFPPTALSALTVAGIPTQGMGLPPLTGNWYFVNESAGSDGNAGTANSPLKTLYRAQQLATANQNDVVCFQGTVHLSPTLDYVNSAGKLTWTKNQVHLIGMCDPLKRGKRARISVQGSTAFSYLVDVSASGCWFMNFGTFYGFATTGSTTPVCWNDTGGRNCYDNVEFLGFGDGTAVTGTAVQTTARAFVLNTSTGETTWRNCVFGVDTITRNATNYTLEIAGGAPRCTIDGCDFEAYLGASGGGSSHILIGASGIDRYLNIRRSAFMNSTGSGATAMTQCMNISGSAGGMVVIDETTFGFGITKWETAASARLLATHATIATALPGVAVAPVP